MCVFCVLDNYLSDDYDPAEELCAAMKRGNSESAAEKEREKEKEREREAEKEKEDGVWNCHLGLY